MVPIHLSTLLTQMTTVTIVSDNAKSPVRSLTAEKLSRRKLARMRGKSLSPTLDRWSSDTSNSFSRSKPSSRSRLPATPTDRWCSTPTTSSFSPTTDAPEASLPAPPFLSSSPAKTSKTTAFTSNDHAGHSLIALQSHNLPLVPSPRKPVRRWSAEDEEAEEGIPCNDLATLCARTTKDLFIHKGKEHQSPRKPLRRCSSDNQATDGVALQLQALARSLAAVVPPPSDDLFTTCTPPNSPSNVSSHNTSSSTPSIPRLTSI